MTQSSHAIVWGAEGGAGGGYKNGHTTSLGMCYTQSLLRMWIGTSHMHATLGQDVLIRNFDKTFYSLIPISGILNND